MTQQTDVSQERKRRMEKNEMEPKMAWGKLRATQVKMLARNKTRRGNKRGVFERKKLKTALGGLQEPTQQKDDTRQQVYITRKGKRKTLGERKNTSNLAQKGRGSHLSKKVQCRRPKKGKKIQERSKGGRHQKKNCACEVSHLEKIKPREAETTTRGERKKSRLGNGEKKKFAPAQQLEKLKKTWVSKLLPHRKNWRKSCKKAKRKKRKERLKRTGICDSTLMDSSQRQR